MAFHGLFVGIDRYSSTGINWLSCATRDAKALHALFTDNLGPRGVLLTDEAATRAAIESEIQRLFTCSEDDVVVLALSGHGSSSYELVTYDADPADLTATGILLDSLAEWFKKIPARRLLCILDCCFSGGLGAKVLQVDTMARSLASAAGLLEQMSGDGRLIFTASMASEPAWEDRRHGHGLLTYYLLQALQGAEETRVAGKIAVYRLLEYVTQRVMDSAAQIGREQHPTLRGQIDGELTWPVFQPGPAYHAAFPERAPVAVTADIDSLSAYGFPQHCLEMWRQNVPSLNALQLDAINEFGILQEQHLVVSAPTSSGKTMVGELAAIRGALERRRAVFLLPLKALVNDKHRQFTATYGSIGLRVIRATGDYGADVADLMRGRYDICLLTYEKFANLALAHPHLLEQIGTIVIDEVQMIADPSRGATLEFILTLLRMRRRRGIEPQLIALSAVIGDTNGLERWLGARLQLRTERPVPLDEGLLLGNGTFRYVDERGQEHHTAGMVTPIFGDGKHRDWVIPLVRKLVLENKQVIVFRETKREARHCAKYLAESLGLAPAQDVLDVLPVGDPSKASEELRAVLAQGVAFHVADLTPEERAAIETHFRIPQTCLRVIAATTTLAMGVNTPASAVIVVGLEHPGPTPYSVAEYKNIVGRAGRLGHAEHGTSYLLALNPHEEHHFWSRYVCGRPEDLQSHFFSQDTDPRSLILRVLVSARVSSIEGMSAEDIVDFLEESFGAFQRKQSAANWQYDRNLLTWALQDLERHGLIDRGSGIGYHLTALGRVSGESGIQVESVIRIVDILRNIPPASLNTATLIAVTQMTAELDEVYFPLNRKSTQKEPAAWPAELRGQNVPETVLRMFHRVVSEQHQPAARAKKAVACLLWMTDKPLLEIEAILARFGGALGGLAGPIQAVSSRTYDILPAVARVAEILHPGLDLSERVQQLLGRLEVGAPAAIGEIAGQMGSQLTRADYLRLVRTQITTMAAVEGASNDAILDCLEKDREKLVALRSAAANRRSQASAGTTGLVLPPPVD
jgi:replicative superfamily II helicase